MKGDTMSTVTAVQDHNCINPNSIRSYKIVQNYLQNTQHAVLRNRPTLSIGMERLACLNSPHGVQLGTLA